MFKMGGSIYGRVNEFPTCEEVISNVDHKKEEMRWSEDCKKINTIYSDAFNSKVEYICNKSMGYLYKIHNEHYNLLEKVAFEYLYYWIYKYHRKKETNISIIKKFHEELIKLYNDKNFSYSILHNYENTISDEELKKLKILYDNYKSYNLIKDQCKPSGNNDFCNEIKRIIDEYSPKTYIKPRETCISKELHNCKNNIVVPLIIPIFIILVLSFLWFIIYKLTPYGSYLSNMIKRKRNSCNSIYEEWNSLESSEISRYASNDGKYNVLYNYT
ncbi:variable surface protein [Plasmodium gonderi]|uniref:Variable surface protein n=1 Tax=Plasmodium gonderi TaxID=77519 RepID=A0A1Y1JN54_PLAGO|nr:variable surface protein [Plasmodium gonderi]GAW83901.1 variable surface protein [Plasmodium gonderi]